MRRLALVASLATMIASSWGSRVEASPLRLSVNGGGGAYAPDVAWTFREEGIYPYSMAFARSDLAPMYTHDFGDSITEPIATPFSYRIALQDSATGESLAELTLAGLAEGSMTHWYLGSQQVMSISAVGEATASDFTLADGVTLDQVPSWFPSLATRFVIRNDPAGPTGFEVQSVVTIAAQVPEPGSVLVFLAAAGAGLAKLRRRGRAA